MLEACRVRDMREPAELLSCDELSFFFLFYLKTSDP